MLCHSNGYGASSGGRAAPPWGDAEEEEDEKEDQDGEEEEDAEEEEEEEEGGGGGVCTVYGSVYRKRLAPRLNTNHTPSLTLPLLYIACLSLSSFLHNVRTNFCTSSFTAPSRGS
jgi:hypothetical protein